MMKFVIGSHGLQICQCCYPFSCNCGLGSLPAEAGYFLDIFFSVLLVNKFSNHRLLPLCEFNSYN